MINNKDDEKTGNNKIKKELIGEKDKKIKLLSRKRCSFNETT